MNPYEAAAPRRRTSTGVPRWLAQKNHGAQHPWAWWRSKGRVQTPRAYRSFSGRQPRGFLPLTGLQGTPWSTGRRAGRRGRGPSRPHARRNSRVAGRSPVRGPMVCERRCERHTINQCKPSKGHALRWRCRLNSAPPSGAWARRGPPPSRQAPSSCLRRLSAAPSQRARPAR
jgi:hypothetical protein